MKKLFILLFLMFALVGCDVNKNDATNNTNDIVEGPKGSLENPYTINEAIDIIGTNTTYSKDVIYVKGIVSGSPYYNSKYKSYSIYLVDQGGTKRVQVYSATLNNDLSITSIEEGDLVVAGGHYTYYSKNNQPELAGDTNVSYPIIYKVTKGNGLSLDNYETFEEDERKTESETIVFDEATKAEYASMEGKSYFWRKGNFIFENAAGDRYQQVDNLPYRLFVQTIVYLSVKEGTIKYIEFETESSYPFSGDEQVTDGRVEVVSNTLTRIYAKKGVKKIRLRNQNDIEYKKQIRVKSIKVVYFI